MFLKHLKENWYLILLSILILFLFGVAGFLGFIFGVFLIKGIKFWIKSEKEDWKEIIERKNQIQKYI